MILYLDASALVKRYVEERGSAEVVDQLQIAETVGTALITRAEVAAALAKAARVGILEMQGAEKAFALFQAHWSSLQRIHINENLIQEASDLVWKYDLRGTDAVHLAAALQWQTALAEDVVVATFDRHLASASEAADLRVWPVDLAPYIG